MNHHVGDAKSQEIDVEPHAFIHIDEIEPEMTQSTNLEGLTQKNSADIERAVRGWHVAPPERTSRVSYITFRDGQQQRQEEMGLWSNGWSVGVMESWSPQHSSTPLLHFRPSERESEFCCGCLGPAAFLPRTRCAATSSAKTKRRMSRC